MSEWKSLEFRQLRPEHESGLVLLFAEIHASGDDKFFHPHPFTDVEAHRICHDTGRDLYYTAQAGEQLLAYGMLRGWEEGFSVPSLGIMVAPSARGTGLAKSFMQFLHSASALRGAPKVRLKVYPTNTVARLLYEKLGYQFEPAEGEQLLGFFPLQRKAHG